jgi:D-beta-D-heptose 7-phosphate kinase/D-beta-D-heptose 1-phosphate adenosyltransferase
VKTLMRRATRKILTREQLAQRVAQWKAQGKTLVFTNGCFDLLHVGHLHLLEQAKAMGDLLIVGVNSDESVRAL